MKTATDTIQNFWGFCQKLPAGPLLFSKGLRFFNPYTGTLGARILEISPGFCKSQLKERRAIQNHVNSIHVAAMFNLAEMTSGIALLTQLPPKARGIPFRVNIDVIKKGRGLITCTSKVEPITSNEKRDHKVTAMIHNEAGEEVAKLEAIWRLGPVE